MAVQFAGSKSLDERRRRRLAQEGESTGGDCSPTDPPHDAEPVYRRELALVDPDRFLTLLLPPQAWKSWAVITLALLSATGVVAAACCSSSPVIDPLLGSLLTSLAHPAAVWLGASLLLASSQLAVVIWTVRARSQLDFAGRYRVWTLAAAAWFLGSFASATGIHRLAAKIALQRWPLELWHAELLCWLVPTAVTALGLWFVLDRDLRSCRSSRVLFWLAGLAFGAAGVAEVVAVAFTAAPDWLAVVQLVGLPAGQCLLFAGMLIHARFVVHVSADPPPAAKRASAGRLTRLFGRRRAAEQPAPRPKAIAGVQQAAARVADGAENETADGTAAPAEADEATADPQPRERRTSRSKKTRASRPQPPETDEADSTGDASADDPRRAASLPDDLSGETDRHRRIDEPIPAEQLKGLSKRQRRELRKQHRARQRAEAGE